MFGHDKSNDDKDNKPAEEAVDTGVSTVTPDADAVDKTDAADVAAAATTNENDDTPSPDWGHPGTPLGDTPNSSDPVGSVIAPSEPVVEEPTEPASEPEPAEPAVSPISDFIPDTIPTTPTAPSITPINDSSDQSPNELIDIKQQALGQLSPLIDHLDQTPEDRFRTTMMMIQASDDQSLIKTAYETAKQIQDEKFRAQALLDIVNEINYFTQQRGDQ